MLIRETRNASVLLDCFRIFFMQLIIDDYGASVGKKGNRFLIRKKNSVEEFSADQIEQIILVKASTLSTDAVKLAMSKHIDIVYLDWRGTPVGRIYPCKLGGTTLTRKRQLEACFNGVGAEIVKKLIEAKIVNQAYLLKSLAKSRKRKDFLITAKKMLSFSREVASCSNDLEEIRDTLFGIEGNCANLYFSCLTDILPFEGRDRDGSDAVNSFLNYGYGILYSEIEKSCVLAGLDPYLGFFHTDRYGKPSMVLDLIEGFRPVVVDRSIITLFAQKQVNETDFEASKECSKRFLSKAGRSKIIDAVMGGLHAEVKRGNKQFSFQDEILKQSRLVAKKVLKPNSVEFEAFVHKW